MPSSSTEIAWSPNSLTRLVPQNPTPFTWSILGATAQQSVRNTYSALGVDLPWSEPLLRLQAGQVQANTAALSSADEAAFGASDSVSFGGLLGRDQGRKALAALLQAVQASSPDIARVDRWWRSVQNEQWQQATLLQVMEEIEPRAGVVLTVQQQALLGVEAGKRQLVARIEAWLSGIDDALLNGLLAGLQRDFGTADYRQALAYLGNAPTDDALAGFLQTYGHWAAQPLEAASPRWRETPDQLRGRIEAIPADSALPLSLENAAAGRAKATQEAGKKLGMLRRRQFQAIMAELGQFCTTLESTHDVVVKMVDAARTWALAAGREAHADGRLEHVEDVFLLELEELKQMMTGEWSSPKQVRPLVARRRAEGRGNAVKR